MGVAVVIPCHNEAESLPLVVDALSDEFGREQVELTILAVDDGSTDNTWQVIRKLAQGPDSHIHGLRLAQNAGKARAQAVGLAAATEGGFTTVVMMDGDGQHDPSVVPEMVRRSQTADTVILGRRVGYKRRLLSAIGTSLLAGAGKILGVPYDRDVSEFLAMPMEDARTVLAVPTVGIVPIVPVVEQSARRLGLMNIEIRPRIAGDVTSNWSTADLGKKGLLHLLSNPWRLLPRLAALLAVVAIVLGTYGITVGIISVATGDFLGIGSALVALVIVFCSLSIVGLLSIGLLVLLLSKSDRAQRGHDIAERAISGGE